MLLTPPSPIKQLLLLLLSLSRVLNSTESSEDLVSEAVWVVVGDTVAPVTVVDNLLGSRYCGIYSCINSASVN
jgi:hypothetical protein